MNIKSNFLSVLKYNKIKQILFLILCILPFFAGISEIPPLDRDESRFMQSSYQMVESDDYVSIKFQDEIRAKKPIGIYWMQAISASVFGTDNLFSYRLPSLLCSFLTLLTIWLFSRNFYDKNISSTILFFLSINLLFLSEAHIAKTDSVLLLFICIQQYILYKIINFKKSKKENFFLLPLLLWSIISIGILIKGPISLIIFFLTFFSFLFVKRDFSLISKIKPILGVIIILILVLPWFILVQEKTDGQFLQKAILQDFILKLTSTQESHGGYPGFYILLSSIFLWP